MHFNKLNIFFMAIAALIASGCFKKEPPKLPEVTVVEVVEDDIFEIWSMVGQTVADPKVELIARVKGYLVKRDFKEGAYVKKGKLLFQIEKEQYKAYVEQADANVAIKEAVLKNAEITYKRNKYLREKDSVSQAELDKATADKDSAIGERDAAKAQLDEAKINLSYTDIKSPFDGRIGLAKYNVGNVVGPDMGTLAVIVSLNPMVVEFNVTEKAFLRAQQEALAKKISLAKLISEVETKLLMSNQTEYAKVGVITFWDNQVNASTGTILMRATFENPDYVLTPGQYVTVQVQTKVPRKGLVMPQVAIQTALGGKFVMIADKDNVIQTRNIKLGYEYQDMVVVDEGLKAGDRVVTQGIQQVYSGMKVNPKVAPANTDETKAPKGEKAKSETKEQAQKTEKKK